MRIHPLRTTREADRSIVQAEISWLGGSGDARVAAPPGCIQQEPDASPFLAAALLPAMRSGEDIQVEGSVSGMLLDALDTIAAAYTAWDPRLHLPTVTADRSVEPSPRAEGTACFFSRGVDSMLSASILRTRPAPLTHLVFSDGLEPRHSPNTAREEIRLAREAASLVGLPLVVVETDIRSFSDRFWGWGNTHGGALAGLGLALGGWLGRVVIPSSDSFASLVPFGSSPLVDPLYSTENVEIFHDDLTLTRAGKVAALVDQRPDLLTYLKVCFEEDRSDNCGRCGKCLVTMAALVAADGLSLATQFPARIDLELVRRLSIVPLQARMHWVAVMRMLGSDGAKGELREAMGEALRRSARPSPVARARLRWDWRRGRRRRPDPSWRDPDQSFDRRFNDEVLGLLVRGEPDRPLAARAEPPAARVSLRPPPGV